MSTHNMFLWRNMKNLSLNYHEIHILSVPLISTKSQYPDTDSTNHSLPFGEKQPVHHKYICML